MIAIENHYWLCQAALAVVIVMTTLAFRAIHDAEKQKARASK